MRSVLSGELGGGLYQRRKTMVEPVGSVRCSVWGRGNRLGLVARSEPQRSSWGEAEVAAAARAGKDPMSTQTKNPDSSASRAGERTPREAVERLAGLLPADELADALKGLPPEEITGPGGLLTQLAGRVIETALESELTEHLGYPRGRRRPGARATIATARRQRRCRPSSAGSP
jgi:hypothetical protein